MIRLEGVSKSFRTNGVTRHILRDVSFLLPPDRDVAVLGRNGVGKSTFLRLIAGTLRPDRGRITRYREVSWPMGFAGSFHPALTGRRTPASSRASTAATAARWRTTCRISPSSGAITTCRSPPTPRA